MPKLPEQVFNLPELVRKLAEDGGIDSAPLMAIHRRLVEAKLVTTGGRGTNAPPAHPKDIAKVLIAFGADEKAARAVATLMLYSGLQPLDGAFEDAPTFLEALGKIFADEILASRIRSVVINRSWPLAQIEMFAKGSKPGWRIFTYVGEGITEEFGSEYVRSEMVIPGTVFQKIAFHFSGGGWEGDQENG